MNFIKKEFLFKNRSNFFKSTILVMIAANTAAALNYFSQIYLVRSLGASDFAVYFATNSIGVVFFSFFTIALTVVTKITVTNCHDPRALSLLLRRMLILLLLISSFCVMLLFVLSPWIAGRISLPSALPIILYGTNLLIGVPALVCAGILYGFQKFNTVAFREIIQGSVRIGAILLLVGLAKLSFLGAFIADITATVFALLYLLRQTAKVLPPIDGNSVALGSKISLAPFLRFGVPIGLSQWALGVCSQADMVIVKSFCLQETAGLYAGVSSLAKTPLYVGGSLTAILLPKVIGERHLKASSSDSFRITLFLTLVCSGSVGLCFAIFPSCILQHVLGLKYVADSAIFALNSLSMSLLAVLGVLFNFFLGKEVYGFLYVSSIVLVLGLAAIVIQMNGSAYNVAVGFFALTITLLLSNICYLIMEFKVGTTRILRFLKPH